MEETTSQLQPNELAVQGPADRIVTEQEPSSRPLPPSDGDAAHAPFFSDHQESESESDGAELEFEFPFVSRDSPAGTAAPADELFANGRIRPFHFYPAVFGERRGVFHGGDDAMERPAEAAPPPRVRGQLGRLFLEESRSSSSSVSSDGGDDGLEGAPPESYCLWTPAGSSPASALASPRTPRKSGSTGSSVARWRRISDLVVGRSRSDGKERFTFFPAHAPAPQPRVREDAARTTHHERQPKPKVKVVTPSATATGSGKKAPAEVDDTSTAHRVAYGASPRRTFLPYREDLVGFFTSANGIGRSHHQLTF